MGLLERKPADRLGHTGAGQIKAHAFFKGVEWNVDVQRRRTPALKPPLTGAAGRKAGAVTDGRPANFKIDAAEDLFSRPSSGVNKHIPSDFPGLDMGGSAHPHLRSATTVAVISRLYNLRDGSPDVIDIDTDVIVKLRRLASTQPLFCGPAPPHHPYPWLFDNAPQDPKTMAYTIAHLRGSTVRERERERERREMVTKHT